VLVDNFDGNGPNGWFESNFFNLSTSGAFQFSGVDAGHLRVSAFDFANNVGIAYVTLTPPTPANVNVTLGNAVNNGTALTGTDGFTYTLECDGRVFGSSTGVQGFQEGRLTVAQRDVFCNVNGQLLDLGGRQIFVEGLTPAGVVNITRKTFSPAAGGFARHLDYLTNTGAAPVTITTVQQGSVINSGTIQVVDTPASTGSTYSVIKSAATSGFVFAGTGATTSVTSLNFVNGSPNYTYGWNVTIPPGQTIILMHFAIMRAATDTAGAETQAGALVNLTDPNALLGMSATEKAEVVNFNVPH
jgi:hypothetical protein